MRHESRRADEHAAQERRQWQVEMELRRQMQEDLITLPALDRRLMRAGTAERKELVLEPRVLAMGFESIRCRFSGIATFQICPARLEGERERKVKRRVEVQ